MTNYWNSLWQRIFVRDAQDKAEVERISALQKAAVSRRAEYAETKAQAASAGEESHPDPLAASRKRMRAAEAAYTTALQAWENRQSRQKSR